MHLKADIFNPSEGSHSMVENKMNVIQSCVDRYGANPNSIIKLGIEASADQLQYETITFAQKKFGSNGEKDSNPIGLVKAVYEWQFSPLVYLVDGSNNPENDELNNLRIKLAMRGDAPFMGVATEKKLDLYPIALDNKDICDTKIDLKNYGTTNNTIFSELSRRPEVNNINSTWIANVILKLMQSSIRQLKETNEVDLNEAISLVGRALFTRFLADRDLLPTEMKRTSGSSDLFDNREKAESTSNWLDVTFNGDFLPHSPTVFSKLSTKSFLILGNVIRKAEDGQEFIEWKEKWANLDFAHVPVGILSQAYESLLKSIFPEKQQMQSAYYTPNQLVNLMVKAAIQNANLEGDLKNMKILDPAAGAGVFLINAFRELVAQRWQIDGKRPGTKILRSILEKQITGFEVDESALRFAALGLYLISIELDPNPKLSTDSKFKNLRGSVLHHLTQKNGQKSVNYGSLNSKFLAKHRGKYDIVIGNPPWKTYFKPTEWKPIEKTVNQIAKKRNGEEANIKIPHTAIDLAFVWYATEWAKPDGEIALVLHSRWLFHQKSRMPEARMAILDTLNVQAIVNCSNLINTRFWPNMHAPFCFMLAQNRLPYPGSEIKYFNSNVTKSLNDTGRIQLDTTELTYFTNEEIRQNPHNFKAHTKGSQEDFGIFERMRCLTPLTLMAFWQKTFGTKQNGSKMTGSGVGFRPVPGSSIEVSELGFMQNRTISKSEVQVILKPSLEKCLIAESELGQFPKSKIIFARDPEIYVGPMTVVDCTPSKDTLRINASVYDQNAKYDRNIFGYSLHNHEECTLLARYLCLVFRSKFAIWQLLLTSGKYGVERSVFEKFELDNLHIPDFSEFTKSQKTEVAELFDGLISDESTIENVDEWLTPLFGLGQRDSNVISETLEFNSPFAHNIKMASGPINSKDIENFCAHLKEQLDVLAEFRKLNVHVEPVEGFSSVPWKCINVCFYDGNNRPTYSDLELQKFAETANSTLSNEFINTYGDCGLLVGKFSQKRYWNFTQARLLMKKIAWMDLDIFKRNAKYGTK